MLIELACQIPDLSDPWKKTYLLNGKPLCPKRSQAVMNHSPDGFNHGYGGSGPAQLALAICLELFDEQTALNVYQQFKWDHIAGLGHPTENEAQHSNFQVQLDVSAYATLAKAR